MSRYVFDIEADNLLPLVSRMWCLVAYNIDTKETKHWLEGDLSWKEVFDKARVLIGHNILGYDIFVLKKLFNYDVPKSCKLFDTLIVSQILDYRRFGDSGHSLENWGEFLEYPKYKFNDFSKYSEEMLKYCIQDVSVNVRIYNHLYKELSELSKVEPKILKYIQAEHFAVRWQTQSNYHGWPFDVEGAYKLYNIFEEELKYAKEKLEARLGMKCVAVDKKKGVVESKFPKWTQQGCYSSHTADWFQIDPWSGFVGESRPIEGEYSRVSFEKLSLDSVADVKIFLFRNGWEPTDWNYKKDPLTGRKTEEKSTPKITEDSLEFLGGDGKLYTDFLTTKSRHAILKTWLENIDSEGNLHGDCFPIGTPSMRTRHMIIANIPSGEIDKKGNAVSKWGPEMRKLFKAKAGWKVIGCDSSGNQARGLAHYLDDENFIDTLLHGDIHQTNADVLTTVLKNDLSIEHVVERSQAKRILYAFLFGASGAKLWLYIFGYLDKKKGNKLKNGFIKAVPGFSKLLEKLAAIYSSTSKRGDGYIPSVAGNKIYVDSYHKLLVYLLQSCEKITCSTAIMFIMETLEKENIPYIPLIYYHDEADFMVPEEYADRAAQIGKEAFKEGPKLYGIEIMDGSGKIGDTWYDVH